MSPSISSATPGLSTNQTSAAIRDLVIIGGGPAALTAAIYAVRSGLSVEVFEKSTFGGAVTATPIINNFPGFMGIGRELMDSLKSQAKTTGAKLSYGECTAISGQFPDITLMIDGGPIHARTVLVATGSQPKTLQLDTSRDISYCALCDGALYAGQDVLVIGGGNTALTEAIHLSAIASSVTVITNADFTAQRTLLDQAGMIKNLSLRSFFAPDRAFLEQFAGIFVCIGRNPATSFLPPALLDADGYIQTDDSLATTLSGLYAAGDVRSGTLKQAVSAAADGALAATNISHFLQSHSG